MCSEFKKTRPSLPGQIQNKSLFTIFPILRAFRLPTRPFFWGQQIMFRLSSTTAPTKEGAHIYSGPLAGTPPFSIQSCRLEPLRLRLGAGRDTKKHGGMITTEFVFFIFQNIAFRRGWFLSLVRQSGWGLAERILIDERKKGAEKWILTSSGMSRPLFMVSEFL